MLQQIRASGVVARGTPILALPGRALVIGQGARLSESEYEGMSCCTVIVEIENVTSQSPKLYCRQPEGKVKSARRAVGA